MTNENRAKFESDRDNVRYIENRGFKIPVEEIHEMSIFDHGSWLGFSIDQIGTTSTGESLTMTVITRTS